MPFNPLMLNNINNNKKLPKLPKEKPRKPLKSLRERLYCWLLIILSSILAGGEFSQSKYFTLLMNRSGLTSLLFLSLMVVDPALSLLSGKYQTFPGTYQTFPGKYQTFSGILVHDGQYTYSNIFHQERFYENRSMLAISRT